MYNFKSVTKLSIRPEFARRLLPQLIGATALLGTATLLAWVTGFSTSILHPWDGLWWLLVSGVTAVLLSRVKKMERLTAVFIAMSIQPVYYYALLYGVKSPVMAVVLPTLIFASLLGGRLYTLWMIGFNCCFIGLAAVYTQAGWSYADPLPLLEMARWLVFWMSVNVVSGVLSVMVSKNLSDSLASAAGHSEALARTISALTEQPTFASFVQTVVSTLADQLGIRYGVLFLKMDEMVQPHLLIVDGRVIPAEGESAAPAPSLTNNMPLWADAEAEGQPFVMQNPADDPRTINKADTRAKGIRTILYVPVLIENEMRALLALTSSERRYFQTPDITLAEALAGQLALALQLTDLAAEAQHTTLLDERTRMAREIHDTLAQGFTGIVVQLDVVEDYLSDGELQGAGKHLERARSLARESLNEARRSVYALRSPILQERTLVQALQRMASGITEGTKLQVNVRQTGSPYTLPPAREQALLRIGQEALTNTLKHAQATTVDIHVAYMPDTITLHVCDDGRGFETITPTAGFGLMGMRERAEGVGGHLDITAQPNHGTTITVTLPRKEPLHV